MTDPEMFGGAEIPSDEELSTVAAYAEEQVLLEDEINTMKDILDRKVKRLRELSEIKLPEAMTDLGLSEVTLSNGTSIAIKNNIYAHISAANKDEAYSWLRENGHGSLIKERVIKESVHGGTLKAFVREQLSHGKPLPLNLFGVHEVTVAVIK